MLTTNGNIIRLIDAFTGQLKHTLSVSALSSTKQISSSSSSSSRVFQILKICRLKHRLVPMHSLSFVVGRSFHNTSRIIDYLGASDGRIHCWNAETGNRVCILSSDSMSGQTIVSMNPKFMLLVSASNQLVNIFLLTTLECPHFGLFFFRFFGCLILMIYE